MKYKKIKKQKGGESQAISWDYGGTGITDLPADIIGVIIYTINTIINAIDVVTDITELPGDMGTAFSEPNAPNPNDVDVTGM
jgi:hypothetical protein